MNFLYRRIVILPLVMLTWTALAGYNFPPLTDIVIDQAKILSPQVKTALIDKLKAHERGTTNQLVVVTVSSLNDRTIEDYGVELGRHWGIGQKDKNNGVILLIAPNEHQMRIEVGYGLEGALTDALCTAIINQRLTPAFKNGDFAGGITSAVDAILAILNNETPEDLKNPPPSTDEFGETLAPMLYVAFFVAYLISTFTRGRNTLYPALFFGSVGGLAAGIVATSLLIGLIISVFVFLMIYLGLAVGIGSLPSGSSSGRGGFSGGGGSFGGGGASGRW